MDGQAQRLASPRRSGPGQRRTDHLAIAFIATRLVYTAMYLSNQATLRSLVWFVAQGISVAIFVPTLNLL